MMKNNNQMKKLILILLKMFNKNIMYYINYRKLSLHLNKINLRHLIL